MITTEAYEVIRWPWYAGGDLRFTDGDSKSQIEKLSTTTRLSDGQKGGLPYPDICADLETACQDAYDAMHAGSAVIEVGMDTAGRIRFTTTGATSEVVIIDISASIFDTTLIGLNSDLTIMSGNGTVTTPLQAFGQWHPKWPSDYLGPEMELDGYDESGDLFNRPIGINHTGSSYALLRRLEWTIPGVPSALVYNSRAGVAGYAAAASVAIGEVNTFERLLQYIKRDAVLSSVGDKRLYLYSSNDPSDPPTRSGPYLAIMRGVDVGQPTTGYSFIDSATHSRDLAQEHIPIHMLLWREP